MRVTTSVTSLDILLRSQRRCKRANTTEQMLFKPSHILATNMLLVQTSHVVKLEAGRQVA